MYINWFILYMAVFGGFFGCAFILKNSPLRYGFIFILNFLFSASLCLFFYWSGFYRYVVPIWFVLPAVAFAFGLLILFSIRYKPEKFTFPFFFMTINWVFGIEIMLKHIGFITFRNGWDFWDSYSLYWIYVRIFNYLGDYIVPSSSRKPIPSHTRTYWLLFILTVILSAVVLLYLILES